MQLELSCLEGKVKERRKNPRIYSQEEKSLKQKKDYNV